MRILVPLLLLVSPAAAQIQQTFSSSPTRLVANKSVSDTMYTGNVQVHSGVPVICWLDPPVVGTVTGGVLQEAFSYTAMGYSSEWYFGYTCNSTKLVFYYTTAPLVGAVIQSASISAYFQYQGSYWTQNGVQVNFRAVPGNLTVAGAGAGVDLCTVTLYSWEGDNGVTKTCTIPPQAYSALQNTSTAIMAQIMPLEDVVSSDPASGSVYISNVSPSLQVTYQAGTRRKLIVVTDQ